MTTGIGNDGYGFLGDGVTGRTGDPDDALDSHPRPQGARAMKCAGVARDCTGKPTTRVRFDGVPQPRRMCAPCLAALTRLGMNPVEVTS